IAVLGLNCATGPLEMAEHVAYLSKHWDRYISVIPNAGLPALVEGKTHFPLKEQPFAEALTRYVRDYGINIVGECCGTSPGHIRALVEELGHAKLQAAKPDVEPQAPGCSSLYSYVEFKQDTSFLIVAERTN